MYTITQPYFNTESANYILVFKTNIRFKKDLYKIEDVLNNCPVVLHWNVDRDDKDNILRIESKTTDALQVIAVVKEAGYICEEIIG